MPSAPPLHTTPPQSWLMLLSRECAWCTQSLTRESGEGRGARQEWPLSLTRCRWLRWKVELRRLGMALPLSFFASKTTTPGFCVPSRQCCIVLFASLLLSTLPPPSLPRVLMPRDSLACLGLATPLRRRWSQRMPSAPCKSNWAPTPDLSKILLSSGTPAAAASPEAEAEAEAESETKAKACGKANPRNTLLSYCSPLFLLVSPVVPFVCNDCLVKPQTGTPY